MPRDDGQLAVTEWPLLTLTGRIANPGRFDPVGSGQLMFFLALTQRNKQTFFSCNPVYSRGNNILVFYFFSDGLFLKQSINWIRIIQN